MSKQHHPVWIGLGSISMFFHMWLIFSGLVPSLISRPIHMALALPWVFLFCIRSKPQLYFGYILTLLGILSCLYIAINESLLSEQYGFINGWDQFLISGILISVTIGMARRTVGWPLPVITLLFLLYGLFGNNVPGAVSYTHLTLPTILLV